METEKSIKTTIDFPTFATIPPLASSGTIRGKLVAVFLCAFSEDRRLADPRTLPELVKLSRFCIVLCIPFLVI